MNFNEKSIFLVIYLLLITLLSSCQPRISNHGHFFNTEKIELVKKTKLNKSEVLEIFGQPTTTSTFSNNVWYYISLTQSERAYFSPKNIKNKVLIITFDKKQVVKKYKVLTEKDSIEIEISDKQTTSGLSDENTLIQEFFSIFLRKLEDRI